MKAQWINPENFADRCGEIFEIHGLEIPESIYQDIHKFAMEYNFCNKTHQPAMRATCERWRKNREDEIAKAEWEATPKISEEAYIQSLLDRDSK